MGKCWQRTCLLFGCVAALTSCGTPPETAQNGNNPEIPKAELPAAGGSPGEYAKGSPLRATTAASDGAVLPASSATQGQPLDATTKRMAQGLNEPLPGYLAWPLLDERTGSTLKGAPFAVEGEQYLTYVLAAGTGQGASKQIQGSLGMSSILLREVKAPQDDFIRKIFVLRVTGAGASTETYTRGSATDTFRKADAATSSSPHLTALEALARETDLPLTE